MKIKAFLLFFVVINLDSCQFSEKKAATEPFEYSDGLTEDDGNYLIAVTLDENIGIGSPFAFVNQKGDTIIPAGKYSHCWTDTLKKFAIVYDKNNTNNKVVAIDRNERILFEVYMFDNWPDEISEGYFRVIRNGKIGYANDNGKIIIPCRYACAFPFENSKAKVALVCDYVKDNYEDEHVRMESNSWFYIDKNGNEIKQ